jgi:hypothetical protein
MTSGCNRFREETTVVEYESTSSEVTSSGTEAYKREALDKQSRAALSAYRTTVYR